MHDAARLDEMLSWHEIHRLLCDYMRGQDRLLPELHRSVFHDDATTDYGAFKGDSDAFVAFAQAVLRPHGAGVTVHHPAEHQAKLHVEYHVWWPSVGAHPNAYAAPSVAHKTIQRTAATRGDQWTVHDGGAGRGNDLQVAAGPVDPA